MCLGKALLTACLSIASAHAAATPPATHDQDVLAIKLVVEAFRTSLIEKDKVKYMSLFFSNKPEDIGWQFVSEDCRLEHNRETKPDAVKARQIPNNNFVGLIDSAVATREPRDESFSNLTVNMEGDIASVAFDDTFLTNDQRTN